MQYWSWWLGGVALAAVTLLHWIAIHRQMAVSGRFTAIVNRLRFGKPDTSVEQMSNEDLLAAIQAATAAEFAPEDEGSPTEEGARLSNNDATNDDIAAAPMPNVSSAQPMLRTPQAIPVHLLFMASLVAGGVLASLLRSQFSISTTLSSQSFPAVFGNSPWAAGAVLFGGGLLVGFGTRMAAGCTSGHGLCGVSRFQPGSLVATAAFFGAGIIASFALGALI